jgi:hypothetical protein
MQNLRLDIVERSTSLTMRPVGIGLYLVDEAIRGVVPPTEWMHDAFKIWFQVFLKRLNVRFMHALPPEQREAIVEMAERPLRDLYSFHLDPQFEFHPERYRPDPDLNAVTYLRRAYGAGAVRDLCAEIRDDVLMDPEESICYTMGGAIRYLEAIW